MSLASTSDLFASSDIDRVLVVVVEILVGGAIAFFMELTEYLLVSYTSGLTLSVAGIIKVRCPCT